jgi:hypothetical protein
VKQSFVVGIKVARGGMLTRRKRHSQRHDAGADVDERGSESPHARKKRNVNTKGPSAGRMTTRSDIVVERAPNERRNSAHPVSGKIDRNIGNDTSKLKATRQSDVVPMPERETTIPVELPAIKSAEAIGDNTPLRSVNGSPSGRSKTHHINTGNKGNYKRRSFGRS